MPRLYKTDWLLETLMHPVTLFAQLSIMEQAMARFKLHNYVVHEFDCARHESQQAMFNAVLHSMGVLDAGYTYENIQAIQFWDLLRSVDIPEESGLVLAFRNFDVYHRKFPESSQQMLSSIAREHFYQLRRGLKLVVCAHSNDASLEIEPLLSIYALWNKQEDFTEESDKRAAKFKKYFESYRESREWLNGHLDFQLRNRDFFKALYEVTGVADRKNLVEMELDASQMIQLLRNYDFDQFNIGKEKQSENDSTKG